MLASVAPSDPADAVQPELVVQVPVATRKLRQGQANLERQADLVDPALCQGPARPLKRAPMRCYLLRNRAIPGSFLASWTDNVGGRLRAASLGWP